MKGGGGVNVCKWATKVGELRVAAPYNNFPFDWDVELKQEIRPVLFSSTLDVVGSENYGLQYRSVPDFFHRGAVTLNCPFFALKPPTTTRVT